MARPRFMTATRKSSEGSFVLGIFVGLLAGIAISVGVAFYLNRTPVPFAVSKPKDEKAAPAGKTPAGKAPKDETEDEEKPKFEIASKNDYQLNQAVNLLKGLQIIQGR